MKKNQKLILDKEKVRARAKDYFLDMCGYNTGRPVSQKKIDRALNSLDDIYAQLELKVLISEYEPDCIDGPKLLLDDDVFLCPDLGQIPAEAIERLYIFILTAGELYFEESSMLTGAYYDLWQNAYVDAGIDALRSYLQELECQEEHYVSNSFGPGFYGMDVSQITQIFTVLNGAVIQVKLLDGGFISPAKSCAGFFLVTNSLQDFAGKDCLNCPSPGKACLYCSFEGTRRDAR